MNWKKYAIYDFLEWLKDIYNLKDYLQAIEIENIQEKINLYVTACYYDCEDNKDYENFTLEDLQEFLESVFI